jgi:hypothetical protein
MPKSWIHFQDSHSQLFFERTFELLKPPRLTPLLYMALVDPKGVWFLKWIRDLRTRAFVTQHIDKYFTNGLLDIIQQEPKSTIRYLIMLQCVSIVGPLLPFKDALSCFENYNKVELTLVKIMTETKHTSLIHRIRESIGDMISHSSETWKELAKYLIASTKKPLVLDAVIHIIKQAIPLGRGNRSSIARYCAESLKSFATETLESITPNHDSLSLLRLMAHYLLDFDKIIEPLLPTLKKNSDVILSIYAQLLHTQRGLHLLSKHSLLDKVVKHLDNDVLPGICCSNAGFKCLSESGFIGILFEDFIESEKGRLMVWLPEIERKPPQYYFVDSNGLTHIFTSIIRSPYVLHHLSDSLLQQIVTMITNYHHIEEIQIIGLDLALKLIQSRLNAAEILAKYKLFEIVRSMYDARKYTDELTAKKEAFMKHHLFLTGKGDLSSVRSVTIPIDQRHLSSCKKRLKQSLAKTKKKSLSSSKLHISDVRMERTITFALNVGLCENSDRFRQALEAVVVGCKDEQWWLALSCYLVIKDVESTRELLSTIEIREQAICELVEKNLYEKCPSVWGWFITRKECFSHYVMKWTLDFFMGDLPLNHIAEIICYCSETGWENGIANICTLLLSHLMNEGGLQTIPLSKLQELSNSSTLWLTQ